MAHYLTQDYSHILHIYFVGVFCCYRNIMLDELVKPSIYMATVLRDSGELIQCL